MQYSVQDILKLEDKLKKKICLKDLYKLSTYIIKNFLDKYNIEKYNAEDFENPNIQSIFITEQPKNRKPEEEITRYRIIMSVEETDAITGAKKTKRYTIIDLSKKNIAKFSTEYFENIKYDSNKFVNAVRTIHLANKVKEAAKSILSYTEIK